MNDIKFPKINSNIKDLPNKYTYIQNENESSNKWFYFGLYFNFISIFNRFCIKDVVNSKEILKIKKKKCTHNLTRTSLCLRNLSKFFFQYQTINGINQKQNYFFCDRCERVVLCDDEASDAFDLFDALDTVLR